MARKGKEIDLGGLRIQIDPAVIATRVLLRQKRLLALIALVGGIATAGVYLATPKKYESRSNILIRYENFDDAYLQKLLNVAVGYLGSDQEMMTIINELDLYSKLRAEKPYEMSLREIRKELEVKNQPRSISIGFLSEDPKQAQRVVAFTTERLLSKMAELNEAPFSRKLEALSGAIAEIEPKKTEADTRLFEFKAKHPEIAITVPELLPQTSPVRAAQEDIRKAERDLLAVKSGAVLLPSAKAGALSTDAFKKLQETRAKLKEAKEQYTDNHPAVVRLRRELAEAEAGLREETSGLEGVAAAANPEEAKRQRIAAAEARLNELIRRKAELEAQVIGKPTLQREWLDRSLAATTLATQYRALQEEREKVRRDRRVAANDFQENFQLVDPAREPELPAQPSRPKYMAIGMAVTALLGLLAAGVREAARQTFVDATELEEQVGLQVFAVLPSISIKEA